MESDRRRYLGLLAGAAAGVAGCLGRGDEGTPTGEQSTEVPTATPEATEPPGATRTETAAEEPSGTPSPVEPSLVLAPVEPSSAVPLTVYPAELVEILRDAATSGETVRASAEAFVYAPTPVLPGFDAVELVDPDGDAGGVYEVDAEGGPRHEMYLDAEEAEVPDGESATPVSAFPEAYRDLVVDALEGSGDRPSVYPETERGEWVREHCFGEYVRYEGTTYRCREVHGTDAVFFSTEAWYVLSLSPVEDAADPPTLRLSDVDPAVRDRVDPALADWKKTSGKPALVPPTFGAAIREFGTETDRILTHANAFAVSIERRP
ncbi:hypothetical protein [Halosimplex amylolyticum]|uniref:hypothetical protein n=1 Tax=Halosimplex amylolyticum TaxID=3396616 RepID=UPI003F54B012